MSGPEERGPTRCVVVEDTSTPKNECTPRDRTRTTSASGIQTPCWQSDFANFRHLPRAAKGSQLYAKLERQEDNSLPEIAEFPGDAETLEAEWSFVSWEISGVRAVGSAYITNFRIIFHAELPTDAVLDVGLADVRSMHLEVPIGAVDSISLESRAALVRQQQKIGGTFSNCKVNEIVCHCQDFRIIRAIVMKELSQSAAMPHYAYCAEKTSALHEALKGLMQHSRAVKPHRSWRDTFSSRSLRSKPSARLLDGDSEWHSEGSIDEGNMWHRSTSAPVASTTCSFSEAFVNTLPVPSAGWDHGADAELEFFEEQCAPRESWRVTEANTDYLLCDSYPSQLLVPRNVSDELLVSAAKSRSKRRLPVLTYFHRGRGSALLRCSQPSSSVAQADREYLELCRQAVGTYASLSIFDCRSEGAALGNYITGKGGKEDAHSYTASSYREGDVGSATLHRLDVPNIYEMRGSWDELRDLVERSDIPENKWLQKLGDTMWLDHCRRITEAAVTVARTLADGAEGQPPVCVVVHCSDGWDRTSQVVSLAQLLMDRRFRTRAGLAALVEKDWRRFGHRFADRYVSGGTKASPIFLQFLFCVAAVVQQFPSDFEYESADLMFLADLRLCGGVGTFLFNSEREARDAEANTKHTSVWSLWLQAGTTMPDEDDRCEILPRAGVFRTVAPRRASRETSDSSLGGQSRSSKENDIDLLLPITSLKRFILWEWAMRFDSVAFSRKKVHSTGAGPGNYQSLGPGLVRLLRHAASPDCTACKGEFRFTRGRYNCHGCGLLFCSVCVQWKIRLPLKSGTEINDKMSPSSMESVCRRCFELSRGAGCPDHTDMSSDHRT